MIPSRLESPFCKQGPPLLSLFARGRPCSIPCCECTPVSWRGCLALSVVYLVGRCLIIHYNVGEFEWNYCSKPSLADYIIRQPHPLCALHHLVVSSSLAVLKIVQIGIFVAVLVLIQHRLVNSPELPIRLCPGPKRGVAPKLYQGPHWAVLNPYQ